LIITEIIILNRLIFYFFAEDFQVFAANRANRV
jgi:hypothetical protein